MAATLEEMTAWSVGEIQGEIHALLPKGLNFEALPDEGGFWTVSFWRVDEETGDKKVVWVETGPDQRIQLFNAYGWLWSQRRPKPPGHSPWQERRREVGEDQINRAAARRHLPRTSPGGRRAPDPEDLDPDEVRSVYEQARKK